MFKTRIAIVIILGAIILSACGGVTPYPTPITLSPTLTFPTTTLIPTATILPSTTPTPPSTPTPETFFGYPTPEAAVETSTCNSYSKDDGSCRLRANIQRSDFSVHQVYIGKYVVRNWCDTNWIIPGDRCAITISAIGAKQIEVWGYPAWLGEETGTDLTGQGKPDIVINVDIGNCCGETIVYEAGNNLSKIMDVSSQDFGSFEDLDNNGSYEYIAPTKIWSQSCLECKTWVQIAYEYQGRAGYVPATYKFKGMLPDVQNDLDFLTQFTKQNPNMTLHFLDLNWYDNPSVEDKEYEQYEAENSNYDVAVNDLYELVVYYLLSNQPKDAQKVLDEYFPPDQASLYMIDIQKDIKPFMAPLILCSE